jgi:hypothetical protein
MSGWVCLILFDISLSPSLVHVALPLMPHVNSLANHLPLPLGTMFMTLSLPATLFHHCPDSCGHEFIV